MILSRMASAMVASPIIWCHPADGEQILDHSQAEQKAKGQQDRLCDDVSRKAVASITGMSNVVHHTGRPRHARHPVSMTVQSQDRPSSSVTPSATFGHGPCNRGINRTEGRHKQAH
jgi:hypothetical protein